MVTETAAPAFQMIPLGKLHESPLNPRKTFDPAKLAELTSSVRAKGVITPLLVRPNANGYEIAAGHRRFRAATAAELADVPAVIRPMDDVTFLEVLVMENDEREDLHPLEEAEGYRTLITKAGYSVERIAERKGCSTKYVYDRVKLLELIPAAQKLFRENRITAGHAILLARLKAEDQKRAIDPEGRALFEEEHTLWNEDVVLDKAARAAAREKPNPYDELKARSVRELEAWIAEHVRFRATEVDPVLFPETTTAVEVARAKKEKVVEITHDSYIQEEAREGKTIRSGFWQRADGEKGSKTCDRSVLGVVVVGPEQGASFRVCVDRERCPVHWGKEIREREKRAAAPKKTSTAANSFAAQQERDRREQEKRDQARKRCEAALPAIFEELAGKLKKVAAGAKGPLAKLLLDRSSAEAEKYISPGSTAEDLVRFLAFEELVDRPDTWNGLKDLTRYLKPFGVDVAKHVAAVEAAEKKTEKPAAAGKAGKGKAKKK